MLQTILGYREHEPAYEPALKVEEIDSEEHCDMHTSKPWTHSQTRLSRSVTPAHVLPIKAAHELFKVTDDRNCIHMEVDLSEQPGMKYKTGDHLGVWPTNPGTEVHTLLKCLGRDSTRHNMLKITELEYGSKPKVPGCTTLDALLLHYLEICAPLSREAIGSLVQFAPTQHSKELLINLSNDKLAYEELLSSTYINVGRLLELAAPEAGAWKHLPLSFIIETLPAMRPRYYSISSSSVVQPRRAAITAVVADKVLSSPEHRVPGLCTSYLRSRKNLLGSAGSGDRPNPHRLLAHVRKSTFKLPALSSHPIVMVAAGTGIAPFRAFLSERARLFRMGRPVGKMILVFGCRNEDQDFLYHDELRELPTIFGSKFTFLTAFSRPHDGRKVYVQDRIAEHSHELAELLVDSDANFYICGSAAMAREVSRTIETTLTKTQGWKDEKVQSYIERQKRAKRWHQDVWG
jgi:NADPH-ferrihemoprotein reductase